MYSATSLQALLSTFWACFSRLAGDINTPTIWHVVALSGLGFILMAMVALSVARSSTREPGAGRSVLLVGAIQIGFLVLIGFLALQLLPLTWRAALDT
jgi:hypothetical protein